MIVFSPDPEECSATDRICGATICCNLLLGRFYVLEVVVLGGSYVHPQRNNIAPWPCIHLESYIATILQLEGDKLSIIQVATLSCLVYFLSTVFIQFNCSDLIEDGLPRHFTAKWFFSLHLLHVFLSAGQASFLCSCLWPQL